MKRTPDYTTVTNVSGDDSPPPVPAHVHYDYARPADLKREYDSVDYAMRKRSERMHGAPCVYTWSYSITMHNVKCTSPRRFEAMDDAINAIAERMRMHAADHEYPLFALVRFKS